jgi:hypothetical protein
MDGMKPSKTRAAGTLLLIIYACYMTGEKISRMGYNAGAEAGYSQGWQNGARTGFEKGREEACMSKPV